MKPILVHALPMCLIGAVAISALFGADPVPASKTQQVLDQAAKEQKYTFLFFFKEDNAVAKSIAQVLQDGTARRKDHATWTRVLVTDAAEKGIVDRFDVSRAPMPLTMAIAPNGAITGIFSQKLDDANIAASFVTRTMTRCMKSMQDGKLVLVCVQPTDKPVIPKAVKDFQADPQFKDRIMVISMQAQDPTEAQFLGQMQLDATRLKSPVTVFLAPPGVMIGKFETTATMDQMAAALHDAGKCCDDPNCKHNHAPAAKPGRKAN